MKPEKRFDLIILGGGPAGMTAAIYAAQSNLQTVIVESNICGGAVNSTHVVSNFPTYQSINGMDFSGKFREHADSLGVLIDEAAEVIRVDLTDTDKIIETDDYRYRSCAVILATGRKPVQLDIETNDCQQIHYCAICDGIAYRGKNVLVIGGGNSGFEEACYLHAIGMNHLYLIEKLDSFPALQSAQDKLLDCKNVTAMTSTTLVELTGRDRLETAKLKNMSTGEINEVDVDGVFIYMGQLPSNSPFSDVLDLDKDGYVLTDTDLHTNLAGVFAAGDIRSKKIRQITTAVADGTIAALSAGRFLRDRKKQL